MFIEGSPKRHAAFCNVIVSDEAGSGSFIRTLKSQSATRWTCHWEAVKAVDEGIERILMCLLKLTDDSDPKTATNARGLLVCVLDFEFMLGLKILKIVLSNTSALSKFLQGKNIDASKARMTALTTIKVLQR